MRVLDLDPARADRDAWAALARVARVPNPFFEPAVVLPAVRELPGGAGARLLVATGPDGWLAALPVMPARRWRGAPVPVRASWVHPYCLLGEPLVAPGPAGEAGLRALLGRARRATGLVPLEQLDAGGGAAGTAAALGPVTTWHRYGRAMAHRRPQDDYLQLAMSSNRRGKLRRVRRQLDERVGTISVTEEPDAVRLLLELEAGGWKGRTETAMATAGHGAFMEAMGAVLAAENRLLLLVLRAGGRPVAATATLLAGEWAFGFRTAFDEELRHFSPGVLILFETLSRFHARPRLQRFDGCGDPANETLNRLLTDRREVVSLLLAGGGALGRAGHGAGAALKASRDRRAG